MIRLVSTAMLTRTEPLSIRLANSVAIGEDNRILDAFRASVDETMREIETEAKTRVRKYGLDEERTTGNLVWAEFVHTTARPINGLPDPHLHAHCFVFNSTWDDKEKAWKAGQFRDLKRDAPYWEAAFHARLALRMRELGYDVQRDGKSWEIASVPKSLTKKFSRRTDQIEKLAEKLGIDNPDEKAELAAKTREKKAINHTMPELRELWREKLSGEEEWTIADLNRKTNNQIEVASMRERENESMAWAKLHSFERNSVIPEKQLLAEALRHGVGDVSVNGIHEQLKEHKVIVRPIDGRNLATTPEMLAEEAWMIRSANQGRNAAIPLNPAWKISRDWLNADQKKAVDHVLQSSDRIMMIRGGAGTGKTSLMKEAVEGMEANGHRVFTFAPSAEASRGVLGEQEGFKATTVAELLVSEKLQQEVAGGVIWVDEAGLLGTRAMKRVLEIAEQGNSRVILSGDWRQHGSIDAGAAMRILEHEARIKPAVVRAIQRQTGEYREAVALLAQNRIQEGFQMLDRLGWVKEIEDGDQRYQIIAKDYADAASSGESVLAIAPTHAEGDLLTTNIRNLLKERGVIGMEERQFEQLNPLRLTEAEKSEPDRLQLADVLVFHKAGAGHKKGDRIEPQASSFDKLKTSAKSFEAFERKSISLSKGDLIRFTANGKTKDKRHRLNNGSVYKIRGFTKEGDIQLANGWTVASDYGFISPGYVTTSHSAQGRTVDRVLIAESSMSHRAAGQEQFYVSVSRGKREATIYTDDRVGLSASSHRLERNSTHLLREA